METDEVDIWAPMLASPLHWPPSSVTIPPPSQVEEYFNYVYNSAMQIGHFIEEPQEWRDQYLGEFIPKENWRRGPRASRKRRIFPSNPPCIASVPSGSRGGRRQCRKNNAHWTKEEVIKLVEGVETYAVGPWTKMKSDYFSTSVRKTDHLKDKWRNLKRACGVLCNSKRKEKSQKKMVIPLGCKLIQRIKELVLQVEPPAKK